MCDHMVLLSAIVLLLVEDDLLTTASFFLLASLVASQNNPNTNLISVSPLKPWFAKAELQIRELSLTDGLCQNNMPNRPLTRAEEDYQWRTHYTNYKWLLATVGPASCVSGALAIRHSVTAAIAVFL